MMSPKDMDDMKYVATQWKDSNGRYCFAAFRRDGDKRYVVVSQDDYAWHDGWSFGGVRKSNTPALDPVSFEQRLQKVEQFIQNIKNI